ncbi:MAG TPA: shikimate kinase [Bacteroidales bacterium]|jgi:shikimate kinase|nr:shikimate kinase [Bacteroidales bacterium]
MQKTDKIYIIGFMGSGKSTTGRKLAGFLKWSFVDLDELIEKKSGMKIRDIFSEKGEEYFRLSEAEALKETESLSDTVIATGGGAPCFGENMKFMLDNGLTIYLKLPPDKLKDRLAKPDGKRPLLEGIDKDNLEQYISAKLGEREKWYSSAKLIIDCNKTGFRGLCSMVKKLII